MSNNPYIVLKVDRDMEMKEIKKKYFQMAKKYHPDLNHGNEQANRMFILSRFL